MKELRFNVRTLLIVTTVVALVVLVAKPLVINYTYPWLLRTTTEGWLKVFGTFTAIAAFTTAHAMYFHVRCKNTQKRSADRHVGSPLQPAAPPWHMGNYLGVASVLLYLGVSIVGNVMKDKPIPVAALPQSSLLTEVSYVLIAGFVWGWIISATFVAPHIRSRFSAFLTHEHFDYPGGPLLPWSEMRSYEWSDRQAGRLRIVFPSNYYISSLQLLTHDRDVDFVDNFLRGKLDKSH